MHGVTRSTTWSATLTLTSTALRGTATTSVRFADFGMAVPRVPVIARVDDPITLELDVAFMRPSDPNDR